MNSNKIFSLSSALILENMKRYWYVPALSFLIYFMSGIFPILISKDNLNYLGSFVDHSLCNWSVPYVFLLISVPLIASVLMMGFMHKPAHSMAIHSQPFSKSKIFNSQLLSGWIMCLAPILLMVLFYLVFMKDLYIDSWTPDTNEMFKENVYTVARVLQWGLASIAIATFFFGMYTLAGSLVGNSTMHVLLSGVFFIIVPLIIWLSNLYCSTFLYGFSRMPQLAEDIMSNANPIFYLLVMVGEGITLSSSLGYILSGIIMLFFAYLAYKHAHLEHVGDTMMFKLFEEIITFLLTFVGMTVLGFFLYSIDETRTMMIIGMFIGSLLSFIIVKIIINRSIKIVNKANIRTFILYLICMALFASVAVYDITGFEKRLPAKEDIQSVNSSDLFLGQDTYDYLSTSEKYKMDETLESEDTIEKVLALHAYIVENRLYDYDTLESGALVYDDEGNEVMRGNEYIRFNYTLKDGSVFERYFDIELDEKAAKLINEIYTSQEYLNKTSLLNNFNTKDVSYIQLSIYNEDHKYEYTAEEEIETSEAESTENTTLLLENAEEINEFIAALEKDHYNRTYTVNDSDALIHGLSIFGDIYLQTNEPGFTSSVSFIVTKNHAATVKVLKDICEEKGYGDIAKRLGQ